jgi:hypothetical protein
MTLLIRRLPNRRVELFFSLLLVSVFFGLAGLMRSQHVDDLAYWLGLLTLELILPVVTGLVAAGLLAGDPALDILLSTHRPAWQVLLERLLIIGGIGVLSGSTVLLLAQRWELVMPSAGTDRIFIWLSPMVFCMGLSSTGALLRGRMLDGILVTLGTMGLSLIALPQIPRLCAGAAQAAECTWWLVSPLMTMGNPQAALWPLNRLIWFGLGAFLLAISLKLAQREEPLLQEVKNE